MSSLWSSPGAHLGTGQVTCSCALGQPWTSSSLVNYYYYYYFYYIYYVYRIRSPKSFLCFSESTEQPRTGHDRRANSTTRRINKSEWRDLNEGGVVLSEYGASLPEISPLLSNFTFHWNYQFFSEGRCRIFAIFVEIPSNSTLSQCFES